MALESIPIRNPSDAARAAVALVPIHHSDVSALEATVYELCLNVVQWAQAPGSVLVERSDDQMIVTVQDDGVGIPATMRSVDPELSNEGSRRDCAARRSYRLRRTLAWVRVEQRGGLVAPGRVLCLSGIAGRRGLDSRGKTRAQQQERRLDSGNDGADSRLAPLDQGSPVGLSANGRTV